jgi:hypothetical protein
MRLTDDRSGSDRSNTTVVVLSPVNDHSVGAYLMTMRPVSGTATDGISSATSSGTSLT